jgi:acyl-CoA reductase-like NAD-dependent aldehyde dehydrogenase
MLTGQEERMPDVNPKDNQPVYTFQGDSPADELHEIARIHYKEAKELLERANQSLAEDRQEEAKLLLDLAKSRRERADEFEKAARGEGGDPIVAEILDSQEDNCPGFTGYTPSFMTPEELLPVELPPKPKPPLRKRIGRILVKIWELIK